MQVEAQGVTTAPAPQNKTLIQRSVAALVVALVALLAINFNSRLSVIQQMRQDEVRLKQSVSAEESRQASLNSLRAYVASDAYVEHWARVEARMIKPGEVAIVPRASAVSQSTQTVLAPARPLATISDEWWSLFFSETPSTP
jgi:cell division protein FtsB